MQNICLPYLAVFTPNSHDVKIGISKITNKLTLIQKNPEPPLLKKNELLAKHALLTSFEPFMKGIENGY